MYSFVGIWKQFHQPIKEETSTYKFRFIVYGIPALFALISIISNYTLSQRALALIVPALTFFVGLLTNSVVLLLRYSDTNNPGDNLIDQTRNISIYLINLGIVIIGLSLGGYLISAGFEYNPIFAIPYAAFIVFVLSHYFFAALLLPARIFVIIEDTTDNSV